MPHSGRIGALSGSDMTLYNRGVSDWIYAYALSSAYKSPWVYDPSGALLDEPDIWEVVRTHSDILGELLRRQSNVVRPWRVAPNYHASYTVRDKDMLYKSKQLAAICHEGLSHDGTIDEERGTLSDAFILGRRYAMIYWEKVFVSLDGTPAMDWWLPYKMQDLDRRRVHWVPDWKWIKPDGSSELVPAGTQFDYGQGRVYSQMPHPKGGHLEKTGVHLEIFNTNTQRWERLTNERRRNLVEYISHDEEGRVGHGHGVIEALFFTHWYLSGTFTKITEGVDRYANGILIARLDSLRNASTDKTNEAMSTAMQDVMNTFRSQHFIVLGDGDDVEVKEATGNGMKFALEFVNHLVDSVGKLLNGSPSNTKKGGLSNPGPTPTQLDQQEAYYQQSRNALDHVIDRDLLGAFLYHNQDNLKTLDLVGAKRPKFTSEQVKMQDPEKAITIIGGMLKNNMSVLRTEAYESVEYTPPGEDDDVIDPSTTMEAQQADAADGLARDTLKQGGDQADKDRTFQGNQADKDRASKEKQAKTKGNPNHNPKPRASASYSDTAQFAGELHDVPYIPMNADQAMWWYNGWLKTLDPPMPPLSEEFGWDPVKRFETKDGRAVYWYIVGTGAEKSLVIEGEETVAAWGRLYHDWYTKNNSAAAAKRIVTMGGLPREKVPQATPSTPESEYWYEKLPCYDGDRGA